MGFEKGFFFVAFADVVLGADEFVRIGVGVFMIDQFGDGAFAVADDIGGDAVADGHGFVADDEEAVFFAADEVFDDDRFAVRESFFERFFVLFRLVGLDEGDADAEVCARWFDNGGLFEFVGESAVEVVKSAAVGYGDIVFAKDDFGELFIGH